MKPAQAAKNAAKIGWDSFEELSKKLGGETLNPMLSEAAQEFGFGGLSRRPKAIANEELQRARQEQNLKKKEQEDNQTSNEKAQRYIAALENEYRAAEIRSEKDQKPVKEEFAQLQSEIVKLAKAAGVDTNVHLEQTPKKIGILDIKRLTAIVRSLRIKADSAKDASNLVKQRANAKPATGMLAWVSGKQMKVHEQGTLQLQG